MKTQKLTRDQVKKMMYYSNHYFYSLLLDIKNLNINPKEFNCIPPDYDEESKESWQKLAILIIKNDSKIGKVIKHTQHTRLVNEGYFDPFNRIYVCINYL